MTTFDYVFSDKNCPAHSDASSQTLKIFGHKNLDFEEFITKMKGFLPLIEMPSCLVRESGGYFHSKTSKISKDVPRLARSVDDLGRAIFFIDEHFIFQRYPNGNTLIFYDRNNTTCGKHKIARQENLNQWISYVVSSCLH